MRGERVRSTLWTTLLGGVWVQMYVESGHRTGQRDLARFQRYSWASTGQVLQQMARRGQVSQCVSVEESQTRGQF